MPRHRTLCAALSIAACIVAPRAAAARQLVFEYAVKVACGSLDAITVPGRFARGLDIRPRVLEATPHGLTVPGSPAALCGR